MMFISLPDLLARLQWYRDERVGALEALPAERAPVLPVAKLAPLLALLMPFSLQDLDYQCSCWSTGLLPSKSTG